MYPGMSNRDKARLDEIVRHKALFNQRAMDFQNARQFKASIDNQIKKVELEIERATIIFNYYVSQNSPNRSYWRQRGWNYEQMKRNLLSRCDEIQSPAQPTIPPATPPPRPPNGTAFDNATINAIIDEIANIESPTQDTAHNLILKILLGGKYAPDNVATDDPNRFGYDVIRSNLNAPLIQMTTNNQAINPSVIKSIFIRDFVMIRSNNISIAAQEIKDQALQSSFSADFNDIVFAVNNTGRASIQVRDFKDMAHRDAIQIIPKPVSISGSSTVKADQLVGAMMSSITVQNNTIRSEGSLQGIFASDGAFKNLTIKDNKLKVIGAHTISINGMLSGRISGNRDFETGHSLTANKIKLQPLRIGGGANIYIIGFVNKPGTPEADKYTYQPIADIASSSDRRTTVPSRRGNATYFDNVDMFELHKEYLNHQETILAHRRAGNHKELSKAYRTFMGKVVEKGHAVKIT